MDYLEKIAKALNEAGHEIDTENIDGSTVVSLVVNEIDKASSLRKTNEALSNKIKDYKKKADEAGQAIDAMAVNKIVNEVQDETGHTVAGDNLKELRRLAKKHLNAETESQKADYMKFMQAHCYGFGEDLSFDQRISDITKNRGDDETLGVDENEPDAKYHRLLKAYKAEQKEKGNEVTDEEAFNYVINHYEELKNKGE